MDLQGIYCKTASGKHKMAYISYYQNLDDILISLVIFSM